MFRLEKSVRSPEVNHFKDPGMVSLFMPLDVTLQPLTRVTIDFGWAFRLPKDLGGVIRLKPNMAHRLKLQVVEQQLGEMLLLLLQAAHDTLCPSLFFQTTRRGTT
jgi:hypothetical protein